MGMLSGEAEGGGDGLITNNNNNWCICIVCKESTINKHDCKTWLPMFENSIWGWRVLTKYR